jgi:hypothetical protein
MTSTTDNPHPPRDPAATPLPSREGLAEGETPHIDQSNLDAAGHVATDTPCDQCGYNLRTLHVSARCPECQHPVAHTLSTASLLHASPRHLRMLRVHVLLLALGLLLVLVGLAACAVYLFVIIGNLLGDAPPDPLVEAVAIAAPITSLVGILVAAYEINRLTRRDPRLKPRGNRVAGLLRWSTLIGVGALAVEAAVLAAQLAFYPVGQPAPPPSIFAVALGTAAIIALLALGLLTPILTYIFLSVLAAGLGEKSLSDSAGGLAVLYGFAALTSPLLITIPMLGVPLLAGSAIIFYRLQARLAAAARNQENA